MCIELNRSVYFSLLNRAAIEYRTRATLPSVNPEDERTRHDRAVNIRRARQLEAILDKARFTSETFNLVDQNIEHLLNNAGVANF